jgi:hypothetical protein
MVLVVVALLSLEILQSLTLMIKHQPTAVDVVYGQYQLMLTVQFLKYGVQAATAAALAVVCKVEQPVVVYMLSKLVQ